MPETAPQTLELDSSSPQRTRQLGRLLGQCLQQGDLIALSGELGSGKTTFTVGLGAGWGTDDLVTSPTYIIINQYRRPTGQQLHHIDAYRLSGAADAENIGMDDLFADNATLVIEWPEHIADILPTGRLWVDFQASSPTHRALTITATGSRYHQRLAEYRAAIQAAPEPAP